MSSCGALPRVVTIVPSSAWEADPYGLLGVPSSVTW